MRGHPGVWATARGWERPNQRLPQAPRRGQSHPQPPDCKKAGSAAPVLLWDGTGQAGDWGRAQDGPQPYYLCTCQPDRKRGVLWMGDNSHTAQSPCPFGQNSVAQPYIAAREAGKCSNATREHLVTSRAGNREGAVSSVQHRGWNRRPRGPPQQTAAPRPHCRPLGTGPPCGPGGGRSRRAAARGHLFLLQGRRKGVLMAPMH